MVDNMKEDHFQIIFHILCTIAALSLSIFWIYNYCLNEDLCKVDYKTFYDDIEDEYPVLSLCFNNFVSDKKLEQQPHKTNKSEYISFLRGKIYDDNLLHINYRDVITNISDFVVLEAMTYRNGSYLKKDLIAANQKNILKDSFVGLWSHGYNHLYHCRSLKVPPNNEIEQYEIALKSKVFPNSSRARAGEMMSLIHFPNQLMVSSETIKYTWPKREKYDRFTMLYKIIGVEVIKRRSSGRKSCSENWKNYDEFLLVEHLKKVGCRTPYLPNVENIPLCKSRNAMKMSQWYLKRSFSNVLLPCKSMQKIYHTYDEQVTPWVKEGVFHVKIWFSDQQFKEITQTRYDNFY